MHVYVCTCSYVWRPEMDIECLPLAHSSMIFEIGFLTVSVIALLL